MYSPGKKYYYKTVIGDSFFRKEYGVDLKKAVWIAHQYDRGESTGKLSSCESGMLAFFKSQTKLRPVSR